MPEIQAHAPGLLVLTTLAHANQGYRPRELLQMQMQMQIGTAQACSNDLNPELPHFATARSARATCPSMPCNAFMLPP